jgi:adenosine tuberculosinyltransferase
MNQESPSLPEFLLLSTEQVARLVHQSGSQVCVFPINGTRRWFQLEYASQAGNDRIEAYMDISSENHILLYRLLFDHGIDTLLGPMFGQDILLRGEEYMRQIGAAGLARLAAGTDFLKFYDDYDVRVRFYGDYRKNLQQTPYAYLADLFDEATQKTMQHDQRRLFFGVFANDATETIAELSVRHYRQTNRVPDRRTLIELYYGEYVEPVDFFIGFDKFSAFDYPLLAIGKEDLYFTLAPSPYLDVRLLRNILYDHLFVRRIQEPNYDSLTVEDINWIKSFYKENREHAFGVGFARGGLWFPISSQRPTNHE